MPLNLKLCHLNVNSLLAGVNPSLHIDSQSSKFDEIYSVLVQDSKFDVIAMTETWLDESITDGIIEIPNYAVFRRDRTRHGGGVLLYVNYSLPVVKCEDIDIQGTEMILVQITLDRKKILIACCYRPPGQNAQEVQIFLSDFQTLVDYAVYNNFDHFFVLGDMNDRCVDWNDDRPVSELGSQLKDLVLMNNLFQIIETPTHFTDRSAYLLDILITDSPGLVVESGTLSNISNLHHLPIFGEVLLHAPGRRPFYRHIWHYNNGDWDGLNTTLACKTWDFSESAVNENVKLFTTSILEICKDYIPNKTVRICPRDKPWMTSRVKYLIKQRNKWIGRYNRSKSALHKYQRDQYRKIVRAEIAQAKNTYYQKQADSLDQHNLTPKKYWSIVRSLCGDKVKGPLPTIIEEGVSFSSDLEKARLLSNYFAGQSHLPSLPPGFSLPEFDYLTDSRLNDVIFSRVQVKKVLESLDPNKATGPDKISNRILKYTAASLADPLTNIFNISMRNQTFPEAWKLAHLCPVPKVANSNNKGNFRPISLLSAISKVMERLVFLVMYEYFMENDLLIAENSGFKKGDSTINQLVHIVHNIYKGLDNRNDVCMVFLDISKAFDKVFHEGLLFKLRQLGIEGNLFNWIESYLLNRQQRVIINGQSSDIKTINAGVPQGSILGPLLFLVFINDITRNIHSKIYLYADDTSLFREITSQADLGILNSDLSKLWSWSKQWRVQFNANKTKYLYFTLKRRASVLPNLYLGECVIDRAESHVHLGLALDSRLEWKDHVSRIQNRVSKTVISLKRIRWIVPRSTLEKLYKSLVRPVIDYGDVIYGNLSEGLSKRLERVQREAGIVCTGAFRLTNHQKLLHELGWEPLSLRREQHQLTMFYKMKSGVMPEYLSNLVPRDLGSRRPGLRNSSNLIVPFARTARFKNFFTVRVVSLWNNLPDAAKNQRTCDSFKLYMKHTSSYNANKLYSYGVHPAKVHHTRLRLGLSGLSQHLYSINVVEHATCSFCQLEDETVEHYFMRCPEFHVQRGRLLSSLVPIVPFDVLSATSDSDLVRGMLFGFPPLDLTKNREVFVSVQEFILHSARF